MLCTSAAWLTDMLPQDQRHGQSFEPSQGRRTCVIGHTSYRLLYNYRTARKWRIVRTRRRIDHCNHITLLVTCRLSLYPGLKGRNINLEKQNNLPSRSACAARATRAAKLE